MQPKNYRYPAAHQVVTDADTCLAVTLSRPLPSHRHDAQGQEQSGAKATAGKLMMIAEGSHLGTR
ncbi:hypothetical protein C9F11_34930 [Streptomyces sp. YIM 121038]|uniref:hypothetical protein n=1 Tax=Streptomyces sp. YIM 121038 TaxID=2136401 RepID=UPI0011101070|nr:hypothetical protein [Streptomyces sp. YIM 121038]QCX80569.1 hypothetical protein C9F11_34930 [Streptomyces sp. YIM 121038]